jgi:hypothetical protein
LILWIGRLGIYKSRFDFIQSRLTRTSRDEIPRFRFDFKHCKREVGDHVHQALIKAFIEEYLEPDGFFFIRMLTVNVSDFVVQEIIEQLWSCYVMKYGEGDAKKAEDSFYAFRNQPSITPPTTPIRTSTLELSDEDYGVADARRKYMKQRSDAGIRLLRSTSALEPITTSTQQPKQQV